MAAGAEKDSLSGLQFRFRSKLLRSQFRERERERARESKPQHNQAGGWQALLLPPSLHPLAHTPELQTSLRTPEGGGIWEGHGHFLLSLQTLACTSPSRTQWPEVFTAHRRTAMPWGAGDPRSQGGSHSMTPPPKAPSFIHIIIQQSILSTCCAPGTSLTGAVTPSSHESPPRGHSWRSATPRANAREKGPRTAQLRQKERAQALCPGQRGR